MSFSFRRVPDLARAESYAKYQARSIGGAPVLEYVPPTQLYEFRRAHKISAKAAAALLGYAETWWSWREQGHKLMSPADFAQAVAKAGPVKAPEAAAGPRAKLAARVAALEARVELLEALAAGRERGNGLV